MRQRHDGPLGSGCRCLVVAGWVAIGARTAAGPGGFSGQRKRMGFRPTGIMKASEATQRAVKRIRSKRRTDANFLSAKDAGQRIKKKKIDWDPKAYPVLTWRWRLNKAVGRARAARGHLCVTRYRLDVHPGLHQIYLERDETGRHVDRRRDVQRLRNRRAERDDAESANGSKKR